MNVSTRWTRTR